MPPADIRSFFGGKGDHGVGSSQEKANSKDKVGFMAGTAIQHFSLVASSVGFLVLMPGVAGQALRKFQDERSIVATELKNATAS